MEATGSVFTWRPPASLTQGISAQHKRASSGSGTQEPEITLPGPQARHQQDHSPRREDLLPYPPLELPSWLRSIF